MQSKLVELIETTRFEGEGTIVDPCRIVTEYWSKDGKLLAENDPHMTIWRKYYFQNNHATNKPNNQ